MDFDSTPNATVAKLGRLGTELASLVHLVEEAPRDTDRVSDFLGREPEFGDCAFVRVHAQARLKPR
ncbi:MAG: hypothetical protein RBS72_20570 [Sedimentisphaerales bacterium]|jgi:hypothetical protein|nr:hypothetical protein [Sedimentisphaerales bacterium]HNY81079.1 hypothetical protein [Sedimentisphaerales bacterium]HOH66199.1 hypothetical protein [Sedimentisphaerales bacterium]